MQKNKTISILGCGWLGMPLALRFLTEGFQVKGSTTTPGRLAQLENMGIQPSLVHLQEEADLKALTTFLEADVLVISFPPGLRAGKAEAYLQQMHVLAAALNQVATPHLLFTSSTSVYPDLNRVVSEADEGLPQVREHVLCQAEDLLSRLPGKELTVVRLAGLAGGNRHPGRFLAGKTQVPNPLAPVNLVHQADCIEILFRVVAQHCWGQSFNACADAHPLRQEYYTAAALSLGLEPPVFAPPSPGDAFKIISNEKVKQALDFTFLYPDPRLFF